MTLICYLSMSILLHISILITTFPPNPTTAAIAQLDCPNSPLFTNITFSKPFPTPASPIASANIPPGHYNDELYPRTFPDFQTPIPVFSSGDIINLEFDLHPFIPGGAQSFAKYLDIYLYTNLYESPYNMYIHHYSYPLPHELVNAPYSGSDPTKSITHHSIYLTLPHINVTASFVIIPAYISMLDVLYSPTLPRTYPSRWESDQTNKTTAPLLTKFDTDCTTQSSPFFIITPCNDALVRKLPDDTDITPPLNKSQKFDTSPKRNNNSERVASVQHPPFFADLMYNGITECSVSPFYQRPNPRSSLTYELGWSFSYSPATELCAENGAIFDLIHGRCFCRPNTMGQYCENRRAHSLPLHFLPATKDDVHIWNKLSRLERSLYQLSMTSILRLWLLRDQWIKYEKSKINTAENITTNASIMADFIDALTSNKITQNHTLSLQFNYNVLYGTPSHPTIVTNTRTLTQPAISSTNPYPARARATIDLNICFSSEFENDYNPTEDKNNTANRMDYTQYNPVKISETSYQIFDPRLLPGNIVRPAHLALTGRQKCDITPQRVVEYVTELFTTVLPPCQKYAEKLPSYKRSLQNPSPMNRSTTLVPTTTLPIMFCKPPPAEITPLRDIPTPLPTDLKIVSYTTLTDLSESDIYNQYDERGDVLYRQQLNIPGELKIKGMLDEYDPDAPPSAYNLNTHIYTTMDCVILRFLPVPRRNWAISINFSILYPQTHFPTDEMEYLYHHPSPTQPFLGYNTTTLSFEMDFSVSTGTPNIPMTVIFDNLPYLGKPPPTTIIPKSVYFAATAFTNGEIRTISHNYPYDYSQCDILILSQQCGGELNVELCLCQCSVGKSGRFCTEASVQTYYLDLFTTSPEYVQELQMSPTIYHSIIIFWVRKMFLHLSRAEYWGGDNTTEDIHKAIKTGNQPPDMSAEYGFYDKFFSVQLITITRDITGAQERRRTNPEHFRKNDPNNLIIQKYLLRIDLTQQMVDKLNAILPYFEIVSKNYRNSTFFRHLPPIETTSPIDPFGRTANWLTLFMRDTLYKSYISQRGVTHITRGERLLGIHKDLLDLSVSVYESSFRSSFYNYDRYHYSLPEGTFYNNTLISPPPALNTSRFQWACLIDGVFIPCDSHAFTDCSKYIYTTDLSILSSRQRQDPLQTPSHNSIEVSNLNFAKNATSTTDMNADVKPGVDTQHSSIYPDMRRYEVVCVDEDYTIYNPTTTSGSAVSRSNPLTPCNPLTKPIPFIKCRKFARYTCISMLRTPSFIDYGQRPDVSYHDTICDASQYNFTSSDLHALCPSKECPCVITPSPPQCVLYPRPLHPTFEAQDSTTFCDFFDIRKPIPQKSKYYFDFCPEHSTFNNMVISDDNSILSFDFTPSRYTTLAPAFFVLNPHPSDTKAMSTWVFINSIPISIAPSKRTGPYSTLHNRFGRGHIGGVWENAHRVNYNFGKFAENIEHDEGLWEAMQDVLFIPYYHTKVKLQLPLVPSGLYTITLLRTTAVSDLHALNAAHFSDLNSLFTDDRFKLDVVPSNETLISRHSTQRTIKIVSKCGNCNFNGICDPYTLNCLCYEGWGGQNCEKVTCDTIWCQEHAQFCSHRGIVLSNPSIKTDTTSAPLDIDISCQCYTPFTSLPHKQDGAHSYCNKCSMRCPEGFYPSSDCSTCVPCSINDSMRTFTGLVYPYHQNLPAILEKLNNIVDFRLLDSNTLIPETIRRIYSTLIQSLMNFYIPFYTANDIEIIVAPLGIHSLWHILENYKIDNNYYTDKFKKTIKSAKKAGQGNKTIISDESPTEPHETFPMIEQSLRVSVTFNERAVVNWISMITFLSKIGVLDYTPAELGHIVDYISTNQDPSQLSPSSPMTRLNPSLNNSSLLNNKDECSNHNNIFCNPNRRILSTVLFNTTFEDVSPITRLFRVILARSPWGHPLPTQLNLVNTCAHITRDNTFKQIIPEKIPKPQNITFNKEFADGYNLSIQERLHDTTDCTIQNLNFDLTAGLPTPFFSGWSQADFVPASYLGKLYLEHSTDFHSDKVNSSTLHHVHPNLYHTDQYSQSGLRLAEEPELSFSIWSNLPVAMCYSFARQIYVQCGTMIHARNDFHSHCAASTNFHSQMVAKCSFLSTLYSCIDFPTFSISKQGVHPETSVQCDVNCNDDNEGFFCSEFLTNPQIASNNSVFLSSTKLTPGQILRVEFNIPKQLPSSVVHIHMLSRSQINLNNIDQNNIGDADHRNDTQDIKTGSFGKHAYPLFLGVFDPFQDAIIKIPHSAANCDDCFVILTLSSKKNGFFYSISSPKFSPVTILASFYHCNIWECAQYGMICNADTFSCQCPGNQLFSPQFSSFLRNHYDNNHSCEQTFPPVPTSEIVASYVSIPKHYQPICIPICPSSCLALGGECSTIARLISDFRETADILFDTNSICISELNNLQIWPHDACNGKCGKGYQNSTSMNMHMLQTLNNRRNTALKQNKNSVTNQYDEYDQNFITDDDFYHQFDQSFALTELTDILPNEKHDDAVTGDDVQCDIKTIPCTCMNHFIHDQYGQCTVCSLLSSPYFMQFVPNGPNQSKDVRPNNMFCNPLGTDYTKTIENCDYCHCIFGFYGTFCDIPAYYGQFQLYLSHRDARTMFRTSLFDHDIFPQHLLNINNPDRSKSLDPLTGRGSSEPLLSQVFLTDEEDVVMNAPNQNDKSNVFDKLNRGTSLPPLFSQVIPSTASYNPTGSSATYEKKTTLLSTALTGYTNMTLFSNPPVELSPLYLRIMNGNFADAPSEVYRHEHDDNIVKGNVPLQHNRPSPSPSQPSQPKHPYSTIEAYNNIINSINDPSNVYLNRFIDMLSLSLDTQCGYTLSNYHTQFFSTPEQSTKAVKRRLHKAYHEHTITLQLDVHNPGVINFEIADEHHCGFDYFNTFFKNISSVTNIFWYYLNQSPFPLNDDDGSSDVVVMIPTEKLYSPYCEECNHSFVMDHKKNKLATKLIRTLATNTKLNNSENTTINNNTGTNKKSDNRINAGISSYQTPVVSNFPSSIYDTFLQFRSLQGENERKKRQSLFEDNLHGNRSTTPLKNGKSDIELFFGNIYTNKTDIIIPTVVFASIVSMIVMVVLLIMCAFYTRFSCGLWFTLELWCWNSCPGKCYQVCCYHHADQTSNDFENDNIPFKIREERKRAQRIAQSQQPEVFVVHPLLVEETGQHTIPNPQYFNNFQHTPESPHMLRQNDLHATYGNKSDTGNDVIARNLKIHKQKTTKKK